MNLESLQHSFVHGASPHETDEVLAIEREDFPFAPYPDVTERHSLGRLGLGLLGAILIHVAVAYIFASPYFRPDPKPLETYVTVNLLAPPSPIGESEGDGEPAAPVEQPGPSPPVPDTPPTLHANVDPPAPVESPPPEAERAPVVERQPEPVIPAKKEVLAKPVPRKTPPPEKKTERVIARKRREPVPESRPKSTESSENEMGEPRENSGAAALARAEGEGSGTGPATPSSMAGSGTHGAEGHKSGVGLGSRPAEFQLNQVDQAPVAVERVEPDYPFAARRQKVSGRVMVKFLVDPRGQVKNISVVKAEPTGIFENSAIEAVGKWRFKPGYYKGQAVSTWVILPIQFKLRS